MLRFLATGLLLIVVSSLAAQKCKYEYNDIDPLTHDLIVTTKKKPIYPEYDSYVSAVAHQINDVKYLRLLVWQTEYFLIPKNSHITIQLSDGSEVTLESRDEVPAREVNTGGELNHQAEINYYITLDSYGPLTSNSINKLVITHEEGVYDFSIMDKKKDVIQDLLRCLQE